MASSRWKRFAFFERNTLSLPSEVLEDLIPIGGSEGRGSRRSMHALTRAATETANDSVSLVVTTGALPLTSKPENDGKEKTLEESALTNMWNSLNACAAMELYETDSETVRLPNQVQTFDDDSNIAATDAAVDGLVVVFVTSEDTGHVHCFDVTVRCNPPASADKDLDDLDGWRGYLAPFRYKKAKPPHSSNSRSLEDRIISEHMEYQEPLEGIVDLATCRSTSGHRPIHMACITRTDLVVCIDPHLYLSW